MIASELIAGHTAMRAALYARYSTDMQSAASIADQLHACRRLAALLGAIVVSEFSDAAISGQAMGNRPGLQQLLALAERGGVDAVIAEHSDRISRGPADGWAIFEDLRALGVRYITVNQGEVTSLQQGAATLVSALFLDELAKKTRRGLEGSIRAGRFAGSIAYGYEDPKRHGPDGERLRGLRVVNPAQAAVVRRIFQETADGLSATAIARALNAEAVPSPRGGQWGVSAIHGRPSDGLGILRNDLYRGKLVWGRKHYVKDRRTGGRRVLKNPGELQRRDVPELRIVSDELWDAAHAQMAARALGPLGEGRGQRRPKTLLGGLIRCGLCGGKMVRAGPGDALRCGARMLTGRDCPNTRAPGYAILERRVLESIQANMLHPDVVADAAREFQRALADGQRDAARDRAQIERDLAEALRRQARLVAEVENGMPWSAVAARHGELDARVAALRERLDATGAAEVRAIHPGAAGVYRQWVQDLRAGLGDTADRTTAAAREAIRNLVQEVRFLPREGKGQYHLEIVADLAPVLFQEPMRVTKCSS